MLWLEGTRTDRSDALRHHERSKAIDEQERSFPNGLKRRRKADASQVVASKECIVSNGGDALGHYDGLYGQVAKAVPRDLGYLNAILKGHLFNVKPMG